MKPSFSLGNFFESHFEVHLRIEALMKLTLGLLQFVI